MIWETTPSGFSKAMNDAFEASYGAASDPRIANNPSVVRAVAAAKSAHTAAIDAASVADASGGFLKAIKAQRNACSAAYLASTAEAKLRAAIKEAYAGIDAAKFEAVAAELYRGSVLEKANSVKPADLHLDISENQSSLFFDKYFLYCEAAALRVLLTEKGTDKSLVREFEKLVFGANPTDEAANKLVSMKSAMKDLDQLFCQKKNLNWARNWLLDIGYDETNPITLFLFGYDWKSYTKMLCDLMPELVEILSKDPATAQ